MAKLLSQLRSVLLPSLCHACGRREAQPDPASPRCGLLCEVCRERLVPEHRLLRLPDELPVLAAYRPDPVLLALIKGWKYSGRDAAVGEFARAMAACLAESELPRPWRLVPVPMPLWRRLGRGFNQSEELARRVARLYGTGPPLRLLARRPFAGRQAGRKRDERRRLAVREFRRREPAPAGGSLILVDDLCTTGATLMACHRVLEPDPGLAVAALVLVDVDTALPSKFHILGTIF